MFLKPDEIEILKSLRDAVDDLIAVAEKPKPTDREIAQATAGFYMKIAAASQAAGNAGKADLKRRVQDLKK